MILTCQATKAGLNAVAQILKLEKNERLNASLLSSKMKCRKKCLNTCDSDPTYPTSDEDWKTFCNLKLNPNVWCHEAVLVHVRIHLLR